MEIKEVLPVNVYYKSFKTTLKTISEFVKDTPAKMYDDLEKYGIIPTGPQIWNYIGGDGNPDTEFTLEIAIPVEKLKDIPGMSFKEFESFSCVSAVHNGPWNLLKNTYETTISEIFKNGKQFGTSCREIYVNCDFENPENNVTEVQIGIM